MNWIEIEKKYPKAWMLLKEWFGYKKDITVSMELSRIFMPERKLYDFFDEHGIYIGLETVGDGGFTWNIGDKTGTLVENFNDKEGAFFNLELCRKEAEEAAFLKAFEILEKKL